MKKKLKLWEKKAKLLLFCSFAFILSCSDSSINSTTDKGDYQLLSVYDSIRSYPSGGGIFILRFIPDENFDGNVILRIDFEPLLNCKLTDSVLSRNDSIVELIIEPDSNISIKEFVVKLKALHNFQEKSLELKVNLFEWDGINEDAKTKLNDFQDFLIHSKSDYSQIFCNWHYIYATYPQILIVEHYSFITKDYEVRLCYHVMIPPNDWSKICIRNRKCSFPESAYLRESNGTIKQIPIEEYPRLLGY